MTRLTDERIASLARQYLGTCKRVFYTKWKDGIDIEYPTLEVEQFARAIEAELSKQGPVASDVPREVLLDKTLRQYAHDCRIAACGAWSDVRDPKGDLDEAKCAVAQAHERRLRDAINELAELAPPLPSAPDTVQVPREPEFAWLIEWNAHGYGPQWWGFNYEPGKKANWCSDVNNAIRFARKEDAERMRLHVIAVDGFKGQHNYERSVTVTEHAWPRTPRMIAAAPKSTP